MYTNYFYLNQEARTIDFAQYNKFFNLSLIIKLLIENYYYTEQFNTCRVLENERKFNYVASYLYGK